MSELPSALTKEQAEALLNAGVLSKEIRQQLQDSGVLPSQFYYAMEKIITNDKAMLEVKNKIVKLHQREEPVLILGETGTGKELIARALHGNRKGPFIPINCSGLPPELMDSELFGHVPGAFTGANKERKGKFVEAKDGTIFLDEIGDMPMDIQARLLRALQFKIITPLGSNEEIKVNCRIIAATNKNVNYEITNNKFRSDLYFRINTFELHTVPLRLRKDDIDEVLDAIYDKEGKITEEQRTQIKARNFMGNYRELDRIVLNYQVFGVIPEGELL